MGDLIEFSTTQKQQNLFYKVTNNALVFYVKGEANASVGLAQAPTPEDCVYWVVIGFRNSCFIVNKGRRYKQTVTHNILSSLEYRKIWISWNNGYIKLGQGNDPKPIFSQINSMSDLNFVTFSVFDQENNLYWKCYLPPQIQSLKLAVKKVKGGKPYWVQYNKKLPENSIIGGYENEILYIMRAIHETALTPGKFVPSTGKGYVAWGDRAHEKNEFEIFCGYDCIWIPSSGNKIPVGAIEAGYTEVGHEIMYVGRALCDGHIIPGKIAPSHSVCYIAYDGMTVAIKDYEILIDPFETNKSINDFYISDLCIARPTGQYIYSLTY